MKLRTKVILTTSLVTVLGFLLVITSKRGAAQAVQTQVQVQSVAKALEAYSKHYGMFPNELDDLVSNPDGLVFHMAGFHDGFGQPLIYKKPTEAKPGFIASYGRDGKLGGTAADQDFLTSLSTRSSDP